MTDEERRALIPGQWVEVMRDNGTTTHHRVKYAPWQLGNGDWVIGLHSIAGGYLLSRVVSRDPLGLRSDVEEIERLRAGLELIAQVRSVSGSAQAALRSNVRIADAVLAGADVRDAAVVEAVVSGKWQRGGDT